jgi:hypothetical protein
MLVRTVLLGRGPGASEQVSAALRDAMPPARVASASLGTVRTHALLLDS